MEESQSVMMRACTRKLALWHTRTFKPIITHDELEPIMATLGFVALRPSPPPISSPTTPAADLVWKEYAYCGGGGCRSNGLAAVDAVVPPPRPRLPYPRIDGLHIYTYQAFIDALAFYLHMTHISDLFHIRGMPLHRIHDRNKKFQRMEEDESVFVYREGTLDQTTHSLYHISNNAAIPISSSKHTASPCLIHDESNRDSTIGYIVPLQDLIV